MFAVGRVFAGPLYGHASSRAAHETCAKPLLCPNPLRLRALELIHARGYFMGIEKMWNWFDMIVVALSLFEVAPYLN